MSVDTLNRQLVRLGLAGPDDEQSIGAMQADRWAIFGDASGDTVLIADRDDAARQLRQVIQGGAGLSRERFWAGDWMDDAPHFKGLDALWAALPASPRDATVAIPRSSERQTIGRVKRLGKDWLLLETEMGEYALVPAKDAATWRLD